MIQKEELVTMKGMNMLLKMKENMGRNINEMVETIHIQTPWSDLVGIRSKCHQRGHSDRWD